MPADLTKTVFAAGRALFPVLLVAMAGSAMAQISPQTTDAIRARLTEAVTPTLGSREDPQTEEVIVMVDGNGHRWIACGTDEQIAAQQAAHEAHGHNHNFHGPCSGSGTIGTDTDSAANANGGGSASAGDDGLGETGDADNCASSSPGSTTANCQTVPALVGQQIHQRIRNRLPLVTPRIPAANDDEDDDN